MQKPASKNANVSINKNKCQRVRCKYQYKKKRVSHHKKVNPNIKNLNLKKNANT